MNRIGTRIGLGRLGGKSWALYILQCDAIQKVFQAANMQKVKDMFSKVQRRNLDKWTSGTVEVAEGVRCVCGGQDMLSFMEFPL